MFCVQASAIGIELLFSSVGSSLSSGWLSCQRVFADRHRNLVLTDPACWRVTHMDWQKVFPPKLADCRRIAENGECAAEKQAGTVFRSAPDVGSLLASSDLWLWPIDLFS